MTSGTIPTVPNETERINDLYEYDILDTAPGSLYEGVVSLASEICDTPMAAVSVVGEDHQWFPAKEGLDYRRADREDSFCAHAIAAPDDPMVVGNALEDPRFQDNPAVTEEPGIRFYAGAPLRSPEGNAVGTLCVLDDEPRELPDEQREALQDLRDLVMAALDCRRLAREATEANAALERRSDLLERSMGLVTEKMRDELSGVLTNLDLVKITGEDLDPETRDHLESALSSSEDIEGAVQDLLDFTEVGTGGLQTASVGLQPLVAAAREELGPEIQERGASLETQDSTRLRGDPDLLKTVVIQLVENALRHGGAPEIRISGKDLGSEWQVVVEDDGRGIPEEEQDHVFELFRRGTGTDDVPGRGVGLAVCRRVVERHGGEVGVASEPGVGSKFWFTVPKRDETAAPKDAAPPRV